MKLLFAVATVDKCTCYEAGNYYSVLPTLRCEAFTQRTELLSAVLHRCPKGLLFDVDTCTCNWRSQVKCPESCSSSEPAVQTASPG